MSHEPVQIEAWHYSVAKLDLYLKNDYKGSATGFFYNHEGETYLITNRHVVIDEKREHYPDTVKIKIHMSTTTNLENRVIEIKLYDTKGHSLLMEHPTNQEVDVVGINIQSYLEEPYFITYWLSGHIVSSRTRFGIGEQIITLCYPRQYHDKMHNLPIGRTGNIASVYGTPFDGHPFFLIDATLHEGTSGSPVIRMSGPLRVTRDSIFYGNTPLLLGVNAGEEEIVVDDTKLGLHRVIYANYIEEILDTQNTL